MKDSKSGIPDSVVLYHGSKSGIRGTIASASRKYRREGQFFDEIIKEGEYHGKSCI